MVLRMADVDPKKLVNLHAEMTREERELLKKWRGRKRWREWLLSIPQLLREKQDEIENLRLKLKLSERDKHDLEIRCKRLQERLDG